MSQFKCVTCPMATSCKLCECFAAVPEGDREIDAGPTTLRVSNVCYDCGHELRSNELLICEFCKGPLPVEDDGDIDLFSEPTAAEKIGIATLMTELEADFDLFSAPPYVNDLPVNEYHNDGSLERMD